MTKNKITIKTQPISPSGPTSPDSTLNKAIVNVIKYTLFASFLLMFLYPYLNRWLDKIL